MDINELGKTRRRLMMLGGATGVVATLVPTHWKKPVINSILVPAHAMTSNSCGNFIDQPVNDVINMVVSATDIQGPITLPLTPISFSGAESSILGTCTNGEPQRQEVSFSGVIDGLASQITGALDIDIFCGDLLVCQQRTTYVVDQVPMVVGDDIGFYEGTLVGTLSCCEQSLNVLELPVSGRSLIR